LAQEKSFGLAVRALITDGRGHFLLLKRADHEKTNRGRWEIPGGKMDRGESFDVSLRREVREETGLSIELLHPAGTAQQVLPALNAVQLVMMTRPIAGNLSISSEHSAYRWAGAEEIGSLELADWFREYYTAYFHRLKQWGGEAGG
jgi:8-oxo-dGTP diphosphatase